MKQKKKPGPPVKQKAWEAKVPKGLTNKQRHLAVLEQRKGHLISIMDLYANVTEMTLNDACNSLGISDYRTVMGWIRKDNTNELKHIYELGREARNDREKREQLMAAKIGLNKALTGYKVKLSDVTYKTIPGEDGEPKRIVFEEKEREKYIGPNGKLIEAILTNLQNDTYKKNPDENLRTKGEVNIPVIKWVGTWDNEEE